MTEKKKASPAIHMAKAVRPAEKKPVLLSTGYHVRIRPVSASLIDGAQSLVEDPEPPTVWIEDKGRSEINPSDPAYLRALERAEVARAVAASDAMIMFGVELVNEEGEDVGVPDGLWLKKLLLMDRLGTVDLSQYDMEDPIDMEFLFKKYIVIAAPDFPIVALASGVKEEDIENALRTFQDN